MNKHTLPSFLAALCTMFLFAFASTVLGATRYVDPASASPTAPYTTSATAAHTIAAALGVCVSGDVTIVAPGTYTLSVQLTVPSGVSLGSALGSANTTIDGNGITRCVYMSAAGASLSGFTIINGRAATGAGVYCVGGTVSNCVISGNQAVGGTAQGGGVYCYGGIVSYCTINGNGCTSNNSDPYSAFAEGGGIYATNQSGIDHTSVLNNTLTGYYTNGAGINANNGSVENCTASGNTAYGHWYSSGGGIYMTANAGGLVRNCLITGNNAHTDRGAFTANWASGGGVYFFGGGILDSSTIFGNTLDGDSSTGGGLTYGGVITNTIIYGNTATARLSVTGPNYYLNPSGAATFDHCCSTPLPSGTGNIASAPVFAGGGYRPGVASPCIDTGINQAWMATGTDLDGNPRIVNATVDIGAYEKVIQYTVTPSAGANGSITANSVQTVNRGGSVQFTATPNTNYTVDQWLLEGVSQPAQAGLTGYTLSNVTANHTVQVTFMLASGPYTVTPSAGAGGSISPTTAQTVSRGASVTFNAAPSPGYRVSQWLVNGVAVQVGGATYTGLSNILGPVTANTTVQVTFINALGAHYWQSSALTVSANATVGKRTGVVHASWPLYFYKGTDNNIWCVYYGGGALWVQVQLTTAANVDDWLTVVPYYNLLCYRGTDGNLYGVYLNGSTWATAKLSNVTANVAGDLAVDPVWNIIYYRGTDGGLWVAYINGGAWSQWSLSAVYGFPPIVGGDLCVDANSHFVYFRGTDNHMYVAYYNGVRWLQVKLSNTPNVGGALTADSGNLVYYRSGADNTPWATYWNGVAWQQVQLDSGTTMSTATSVSSLYALHTWLYLDANGQCGVEYVNGSSWAHAKLGDGGSSLVGGLSVQHGTNWAFAQRSDGHVVIFYYQ